MRTYICGIAVQVRYLDRVDQTLLHFTRCSSQVERIKLSDWLQQHGISIVPGHWSYIVVQGSLRGLIDQL